MSKRKMLTDITLATSLAITMMSGGSSKYTMNDNDCIMSATARNDIASGNKRGHYRNNSDQHKRQNNLLVRKRRMKKKLAKKSKKNKRN